MFEIDGITELLQSIIAEEVLPRFGKLERDEILGKPSVHDPHDVVSIVDQRVEEILGNELARRHPGSTIIGEEAVASDPGLLHDLASIDRLWLIDPIDGTKAFVRSQEDFGVMLGYVEKGEPAASWILLPVKGEAFVSERGAGAQFNGTKLLPGPAPDGLPVGSFHTRFMPADTRTSIEVKLQGRYINQSSSGCAAIEYTDLARSRKDFAVYYRLMPWDHIPGSLLLRELGGVVQHLDGQPYSLSSDSQLTIAARSENIYKLLLNS